MPSLEQGSLIYAEISFGKESRGRTGKNWHSRVKWHRMTLQTEPLFSAVVLAGSVVLLTSYIITVKLCIFLCACFYLPGKELSVVARPAIIITALNAHSLPSGQ